MKTAVAKAMGKVRADDDMLTLLNAHASLKPKAIEKVDVANEFFGTAAVVDKAKQAQAHAGQRLKQSFGGS